MDRKDAGASVQSFIEAVVRKMQQQEKVKLPQAGVYDYRTGAEPSGEIRVLGTAPHLYFSANRGDLPARHANPGAGDAL